MTPKTEQHLREAWHGPLSSLRVARKYRISSARRVREFWAAEKESGRLPDGPRPHFVDCTAPISCALDPAAAVDAAADLDLDREIGCAERCDDIGIPSHDPLLAALERHHGNDRRRRLDDLFFPDDILRVPNAARLRGKRKFIDAAMTAVAKNPERYEAAFR